LYARLVPDDFSRCRCTASTSSTSAGSWFSAGLVFTSSGWREAINHLSLCRTMTAARVRFEADSLMAAAETQIVRLEYARSLREPSWDGTGPRPVHERLTGCVGERTCVRQGSPPCSQATAGWSRCARTSAGPTTSLFARAGAPRVPACIPQRPARLVRDTAQATARGSTPCRR